METSETTRRGRPVWTALTILLGIVCLLQLGLLFQRQLLLKNRTVLPARASVSLGNRIRNLLPWNRRTPVQDAPATITPDTVWDGSTRIAQMHSRINRLFEEAFHDSFSLPLAPAVVSAPPASNGSAPSDPFRRMRDMHRQIDVLFQEAIQDVHGRHAGFDDGWADLAITPGMTVKDTGESYDITVALPSVNKSDIRLVMDGSILTLLVDHSETRDAAGDSAAMRSRRISRFEQRIKLPGADPDPDRITASFQDGVLRIVVPKRPGNEYEKGSIRVI